MSKFVEPAFGLCENVRDFDKVLISMHMLGIALLLFATTERCNNNVLFSKIHIRQCIFLYCHDYSLFCCLFVSIIQP